MLCYLVGKILSTRYMQLNELEKNSWPCKSSMVWNHETTWCLYMQMLYLGLYMLYILLK
ncbi:Uncharacterised protein [Klebsiella pneumoniae]|nr:Uncharacterised protein [Acinetobacter baumannii]SVL72186.1 Uncharacterised protein [Klebsiella pneumoniae]